MLQVLNKIFLWKIFDSFLFNSEANKIAAIIKAKINKIKRDKYIPFSVEFKFLNVDLFFLRE